MRDAHFKYPSGQTLLKKYLPLALLLLALIAALGLFFALQTGRAVDNLASTTVISQSALEQEYGLRVNLLALTAAGGMVDLRLKILDAEMKEIMDLGYDFAEKRTLQFFVGGPR